MERQAKDGTIYQQVGKDEWTPVTRQAKDGTTYRKVGQDDWTPMEAQSSSPRKEPKEVRDEILGIPVTTIEGALDAFPFAGAVFGGAAGGAVGGLPALAGAGAGAYAGEAAANAIRAALDLDSAPQTRSEIYGRPIKAGLEGAAGEGAGQIISKIPGAIKQAPKAIRNLKSTIQGKPKIPDEVLPAVNFEDVAYDAIPRPNAQEVIDSTKRIGGKATPGMVTSNQNIQNLENVLSQSPTIAGEKVRRAYQPIRKGLQEASENLAGAPNMTPFEAGQQFKTGLSKKITKRVEPLSTQFEKIRESSRYIKPDAKSLNRSAERLLKQDMAEFADLPQGQAIQKYAEMIKGAKSLDSLKQLRSSVGDDLEKALNAGEGQLAYALGKVKNSIQRLERREILKSAIEAMPTKAQGEAAAKELIDEIKTVNKGWRSLMTELQAVADAGGIKKIGSPSHLARIIDDMPSEKVAERFFNTKNFAGLKDVKTHLPEEFEILRQSRLGQIAEKSLTKGEPDPVKLVRNIKAIGKESRELLFGKNSERVLKDMETILNSMPSKVGASDTPRGIEWFGLLKPSQWGQEAQSAYNYMQLTGRISKRPPTQGLSKMLPRAAGYGAVGTVSNENAKGRDKWAADGIAKLNIHSGSQLLDPDFNVKQASPKLKNLLIQASDLKPGSKAMGNVLSQIEKEFGGGN